ncbi:MAG: FAD/NAD(P)-binding protein [Polyangiales bacterium]|jgi:NAD(P)H-flavin reductase
MIASSRLATPEAVRAERDIYLPSGATVTDVKRLTPWEKYFKFKMDDDGDLGYMPGQFMKVSLPGVGECPISITSSPTRTRGNRLEMVIRAVGSMTHALHALRPGDRVGFRGPFGTSFPVTGKMRQKDLLIICGGLGHVPLKSVIEYVLDERHRYGQITILIGNRSPDNRLFIEQILEWKQRDDITCMETVDVADPSWGGNVGPITTLLPRVRLFSPDTVCIICGPPVMYKYVLRGLEGLKLDKSNVYMSLERRMRCGVGKCGHCQINNVYGCQQGPVFTYRDILEMGEAI